MQKDDLISRHVYCFNKDDNGGESLSLKTNLRLSDDDEVYASQQLTLASYANSASFDLSLFISPDILRDLANQLESELIKAKEKVAKNVRKS